MLTKTTAQQQQQNKKQNKHSHNKTIKRRITTNIKGQKQTIRVLYIHLKQSFKNVSSNHHKKQK